MIADSSALLAIVFQEPSYELVLQALIDAPGLAIGAPTVAETAIVIGRRLGFERVGLLPRLLQEFGIAVVPFEEMHWAEAFAAYERFGRGRHHARLNFGDCLTYAVARVADEPILCVGDDFVHTDVSTVPLALR